MSDEPKLTLPVAVTLLIVFLCLPPIHAQVETVEGSATPHWVAAGRFEGHLAPNDSPAGAFSPQGTTLAAVNGDKVALADLGSLEIRKVLHPRVEGVSDLEIQSANFVGANRVFILASGLVVTKNKETAPHTPELAFLWDTTLDALSGKVSSLSGGGGYKPPRYFPDIHYLTINKQGDFTLWNPLSGRGGKISIPALTRPANLYSFSPDGHWLLLAQIESSSQPDPVVVHLSEHQFVDSLAGHQGTVLSINFSRDTKRVVTACEDGKVRVFSAPDWKLLKTLAGHSGAVHWAELSPDGRWIVSAGEDATVRVWSAEDGRLLQSLEESKAPLFTAAFSPDGNAIAATTDKNVFVWKREP